MTHRDVVQATAKALDKVSKKEWSAIARMTATRKETEPIAELQLPNLAIADKAHRLLHLSGIMSIFIPSAGPFLQVKRQDFKRVAEILDVVGYRFSRIR